jgi:hypothetical protein
METASFGRLFLFTGAPSWLDAVRSPAGLPRGRGQDAARLCSSVGLSPAAERRISLQRYPRFSCARSGIDERKVVSKSRLIARQAMTFAEGLLRRAIRRAARQPRMRLTACSMRSFSFNPDRFSPVSCIPRMKHRYIGIQRYLKCLQFMLTLTSGCCS